MAKRRRTAKQKAALRKAQLASARKRRRRRTAVRAVEAFSSRRTAAVFDNTVRAVTAGYAISKVVRSVRRKRDEKKTVRSEAN